MLQHIVFDVVVHFCDVALHSFSVCFFDVSLGSLFMLLGHGGTVGESGDAGSERVPFYSHGGGGQFWEAENDVLFYYHGVRQG